MACYSYGVEFWGLHEGTGSSNCLEVNPKPDLARGDHIQGNSSKIVPKLDLLDFHNPLAHCILNVLDKLYYHTFISIPAVCFL